MGVFAQVHHNLVHADTAYLGVEVPTNAYVQVALVATRQAIGITTIHCGQKSRLIRLPGQSIARALPWLNGLDVENLPGPGHGWAQAVLAPFDGLQAIAGGAYAHLLKIGGRARQHGRRIGQVIDWALQANLAREPQGRAKRLLLGIIMRIIRFIGTRKVGHEAEHLDVWGIAQHLKGLCPILFIHTGAVHAGFHLDVYLSRKIGLDQLMRLLKGVDRHLDSIGQGFFEDFICLPNPRHDGRIHARAAQVHGLPQGGHAKAIRAGARHHRHNLGRAMPIGIGLDHAHQLDPRPHLFLDEADVVRNSGEINRGFQHAHHCATAHPCAEFGQGMARAPESCPRRSVRNRKASFLAAQATRRERRLS